MPDPDVKMISMRLPVEALDRLDRHAKAAGLNRTEFVTAWIEGLDAHPARVAPKVTPSRKHPGGRKTMATGEKDRMPTDMLTQRAEDFAQMTQGRGKPTSYGHGTPPKAGK